MDGEEASATEAHTVSDYFIYYAESTLICLIIFCMMLVRDLFKVDKQEKQIRYDHALIAFMLYFASDLFWAAVISGVIPKTRFTVSCANFLNAVLMGGITYALLRYVMAAENAPHRDKPLTKFSVIFPYMISAVVLLALFVFAPHVLMDDQLAMLPAYNIFLVVVPCIYIAASCFYAVRKARHEENPIERRQHMIIGFFPLMVIAGGLLQILILPNTPIFCYCCTILMLWFYFQSMEAQISLDPLTGLNNRGQLMHYISQKGNAHIEGRSTFVVMFDVDDFKAINDTFGHAEGDRALVIIAESLKKVTQSHNMPIFLGRYGGDEFILIAHPANRNEIDPLISEIRGQINARCEAERTPYRLSVGAGYEEMTEKETFQKCMQRADENLYLDKERRKAAK